MVPTGQTLRDAARLLVCAGHGDSETSYAKKRAFSDVSQLYLEPHLIMAPSNFQSP